MLAMPALKGADLRDVSFAYEPGKPVLQQLNCAWNPDRWWPWWVHRGRENHPLLFLLRFNQAQQGELLLDGVDLRDLRAAGRRRCLVPQQSALFSGTVAEAIRFGRTPATPRCEGPLNWRMPPVY